MIGQVVGPRALLDRLEPGGIRPRLHPSRGPRSSAVTGGRLSQVALRLKFAFYPLLALGAIAWLAWDWSHARSLNSAEDAIFDRVVQWRPFEPQPSGRVVVVEIDECSIEYFRARNEGGWPWSRQRHADLLDQLDRAGVRAVGYDVLFVDPSPGRSRSATKPWKPWPGAVPAGSYSVPRDCIRTTTRVRRCGRRRRRRRFR